jgi:hypothetical protein
MLDITGTHHDLKPWAEDLGHHAPGLAREPAHRVLRRAGRGAFRGRESTGIHG